MITLPTIRPRRLRQNAPIRELVRETTVMPSNLVAPLFVVPGKNSKSPIASLPGQFHLSPDCAVEEAQILKSLGIKGVLLFGLPEHKDEQGTSSYDNNGVVQQTARLIKQTVPDILVMADLCFCEHTSHGHCGIIKNENVDNDATLDATQLQTLSLAKAGVDIIAPSGMMDGVVKTVRQSLDSEGFTNTLIMAYSAKYASAYYGPFRDAVDSTPAFGDRRTYQMDPANQQEALREVQLDIEEGADIVMVKPALAYLDVIAKVKEQINVPLAAYNVSGEYAMIKLAAEKGLVDEAAMVAETLTSIKRAGADIIISYFAKEFVGV